MEECKDCELALYCYSEPSSWVFRTKQEMEEKQVAIESCETYRRKRKTPSGSRPVAQSTAGR